MNTNKTIGIVIGALIVIGGAFYIVKDQQTPNRGGYRYQEPVVTNPSDTGTTKLPPAGTSGSAKPVVTTSTTVSTKTQTSSESNPKQTAGTYTTAQVATHNSGASCWTIVNGNVYDVTSWISKHPGGQGAIKGMCGIDASDEFNEQHGGQGGPERVLAGYKIGTLAK